MKLKRRAVAVIAIAAASLCLGAAAFVGWRVERTLGGLRRDEAQKGVLGVEVRTLGAIPNLGFEAITAPAVFTSAAVFQGRIYLAGPAGLSAYTGDGLLEHVYRAGMDLPAAPLTRMQVGMLTGARQAELLIGTSGAGVLAFDGHGFRQILPDQPEARDVTAVLPLGTGRLLIGTAKLGVLVWDGTTLKSFHTTTDNVYVTALAGSEAELWVGTLNAGVLYWHGGETDRIGEAEGLPDARVESIALGTGGVAWGRAYVGTPVGVAEMRDGKVLRVVAQGSFAHAVAVDGDQLLVGPMEAGVMRVSLAGGANDARARRPIVARVSDVAAGPRSSADAGARDVTVEQFLSVGDAHYALASDGLLTQGRDGAWRRLQDSSRSSGAGPELAASHVSALMVDSTGRLWVGYFDRGLDILPAAGGEAVHVENEHVFCVNRIVEDPRDGAVAVATANGLVMFDRDGRQKQVLGRDAGLIADHVTDVAVYGDGLALATPAGITFLDASGAHSLYAFQGLVNNHVYALGASGSSLVAGTLGGLSLLTGGEVRRNLTMGTSGLKHNWITALAGVGGDWMVGTYGAGVLRLGADGSVTSTEMTRAGMVVNPTALVADGRVVLAGTLGGGLLVGDATGTRWKTATAGLPSLNVTALAVRGGVVYVGTESGLVKIAEDKLL